VDDALRTATPEIWNLGPGPSAEEIDENRREMFRGFAADAP